MDTKTFKKIARLLKTVYLEIEQEAIKEGISTLSPEYDQLIALARNKVLENQGFTLQQYREAKAKVAGFSQADLVDSVEQTANKVQEYNNQHIPTSQEIEQIAEKVAESVAQKYIVPPQITNQIVKETTIEKPITIETTRVTRETYNDKPLRKEIKRVLQQLDEIKIPEQISVEQLKKELHSDFSVFFEHNINTLDMPNFRKLAMGLQGQIDDLANRDTLDLTTYVPYTGATGDVDLGSNSLTVSNGIFASGNIDILSGSLRFMAPDGIAEYAEIGSTGANLFALGGDGSVNFALLDVSALTGADDRTFTFPDASGTIALTSDLAGKLNTSGGTMTGGITNSTSVNPLTTLAESWIGPSSTAGVYFKNGNVGIGTTNPTAVLHLKAGTATAGTAPLGFTSGTLLTTPVAGKVEYLSGVYYATDAVPTRNIIAMTPVANPGLGTVATPLVIVTASLGTSQGSMTFINGILVASTPAT